MSASAPVADDFSSEGKSHFYPSFPYEQNQQVIQQHPPPPYSSTQQQYLQTQGVPLAGMTSYGQPAPPPVSVIHVQTPGVSGCPNCHVSVLCFHSETMNHEIIILFYH